MKIVTIVGARPQFIKAAVVSRELRKTFKEVLVHTGQHYDHNMSEVFFEELDIPKPDYNLGISGGTHGEMTGKMIIALDGVLEKERPDAVLLYGDTNSTLAGAIAAVKLHIPIVHVEAGNRLGTLANPEEVNRIVTDHVSNLKLYCTESAAEFLRKEGIFENSFLVGDPMYDAFKHYCDKLGDQPPELLNSINGDKLEMPERFYYMTCHREENTKDIGGFTEILKAVDSLDYPCIYPVHPRNQAVIRDLELQKKYKNILFCMPVGYMMSIYLIKNCEKIITDSGGLQREAYFAKKQCVTLFDKVIWPETMNNNRNQLSRLNSSEILEKLSKEQIIGYDQPFGDGHAAEKIVDYINIMTKDFGGKL